MCRELTPRDISAPPSLFPADLSPQTERPRKSRSCPFDATRWGDARRLNRTDQKKEKEISLILISNLNDQKNRGRVNVLIKVKSRPRTES